MSGLSSRQKQHFPLTSNEAVLGLFKEELLTENADLTLLSLVTGYLEQIFCVSRTLSTIDGTFPTVVLTTIENLYKKFQAQIREGVDISGREPNEKTECALVKRISDVVWCQLSRNYQDRAHLQSLYSLLTSNKLDCFGVALATVAACQQLGLNDVHLTLSEDHAWVVFADGETAEVTWHGKGNEDKRGRDVSVGLNERSWLYLGGQAMVCSRAQEVVSLVASLNPAITAVTDSTEMSQLQQELLWMLYDLGHLERYPMALSNLAECEEISPSAGRPHPEELHLQSVMSAERYYSNAHVYPHTTFGSYLMRNSRLPEAVQAWAQAASVIAGYNYSREDEEIYKEFLEIATEHLPALLQASGSLGSDPHCFANLLRFYDGMCTWEEGSATPVLHEGWANMFCRCVGHFTPKVRANISLVAAAGEGTDASLRVSRRSTGPSAAFLGQRITQNDLQSKLQQLEQQTGNEEPSKPQSELTALAEECTHSVLNPEYLLGRGEPFAPEAEEMKEDSSADATKENKEPSSSEASEVTVRFNSAKMCAIINLLQAEKVNNPALRLQLTAQSQVSVRPHRRSLQDPQFTTFPIKRSRKSTAE